MKHRFSDERTIGMIKEYEAGARVLELCRKYGIIHAMLDNAALSRRLLQLRNLGTGEFTICKTKRTSWDLNKLGAFKSPNSLTGTVWSKESCTGLQKGFCSVS